MLKLNEHTIMKGASYNSFKMHTGNSSWIFQTSRPVNAHWHTIRKPSIAVYKIMYYIIGGDHMTNAI